MWIKLMKNVGSVKAGGVIWCDGKAEVNSGNAIRVLGPDGKIFEDASPEEIIKQLAAEEGLTTEKEGNKLRKLRKQLKGEDKRKHDLGQLIP